VGFCQRFIIGLFVGFVIGLLLRFIRFFIGFQQLTGLCPIIRFIF